MEYIPHWLERNDHFDQAANQPSAEIIPLSGNPVSDSGQWIINAPCHPHPYHRRLAAALSPKCGADIYKCKTHPAKPSSAIRDEGDNSAAVVGIYSSESLTQQQRIDAEVAVQRRNKACQLGNPKTQPGVINCRPSPVSPVAAGNTITAMDEGQSGNARGDVERQGMSERKKAELVTVACRTADRRQRASGTDEDAKRNCGVRRAYRRPEQ